MEGNASVYQVNPAGRITGEGRAEILRAWGPWFEQQGAGGRGATPSVRGNYDSFKGTKLTVLNDHIPGTLRYMKGKLALFTTLPFFAPYTVIPEKFVLSRGDQTLEVSWPLNVPRNIETEDLYLPTYLHILPTYLHILPTYLPTCLPAYHLPPYPPPYMLPKTSIRQVSLPFHCITCKDPKT